MADKTEARRLPRRRRKGPRARVDGRALRLGNRRVPLLSGAVHYWRLRREAWRPALEEVVALGLPMVETYVPWSIHETAPYEYDFGERDPQKDVGAFLDLAAELDLLAFVRPGPHINAEMTCFGLPERIIYDKACQARSVRQNPVILPFPPQMFPVPSYASTAFHREVGQWFDAVGRVIAPRLWPDGPVAVLQVDNEAAYYFRNGPYDQDYHPDAAALWQRFLEERHGDLAEAAKAHARTYKTWDDCHPPTRFDAQRPEELPLHLDWARFQEAVLEDALVRMRRRMNRAGMRSVPTAHNVPLGDSGQPISVPRLARTVDLIGLDYYHPAREHRTIKRRTLYQAGSVELPYAPEMGAGAPPWFTPLSHDDSLFCAMCACAYGLRGLNLYMAVDRDRWYGAPVDAQGAPRVEAGAWKRLFVALRGLRFHELSREVEVALVVPREYARMSRATHVLGPISPSTLEALGGSPVDGSREDPLGFTGPIQVLWWRMLSKAADALTKAGIPYVYVDSDCAPERLDGLRLVIAPTYEFAARSRWQSLVRADAAGTRVVYGPALPTYDDRMQPLDVDPLPHGRRVLLDTPEDADRLVGELLEELGLARPFSVIPAPLETAVHGDDRGPRVLFVMNPTVETLEATVTVPAPTTLRDVMTEEIFSADSELTLPVTGRTCRMFELTVRGASSRPRARARRPS